MSTKENDVWEEAIREGETKKQLENDLQIQLILYDERMLGILEGKQEMREKILNFINQRFIETKSSEDSATTALWNVMQDIKKFI